MSQYVDIDGSRFEYAYVDIPNPYAKAREQLLGSSADGCFSVWQGKAL